MALRASLLRCLWGAKTRCTLREIGDLQARRQFWHPTGKNAPPLEVCRSSPRGSHDPGSRPRSPAQPVGCINSAPVGEPVNLQAKPSLRTPQARFHHSSRELDEIENDLRLRKP